MLASVALGPGDMAIGRRPIRCASISLLIGVLFFVIVTSVVRPCSLISARKATVSTSVIMVRRKVFAYPTVVGSRQNFRTLGNSGSRLTSLKTESAGARLLAEAAGPIAIFTGLRVAVVDDILMIRLDCFKVSIFLLRLNVATPLRRKNSEGFLE